MKKITFCTFTFIMLFSNHLSFAQLVINEYSCSNTNTFADNYNKYEDWIEIYNTSASSINISGYYLSDKTTNLTKWQIPVGVSIPANGRIMVICDGRDEYSGGYLHTNFKLTQTKPENIVFSNAATALIENIQLIPTQKGHSRGRTTDGANTWALFTTPTPNNTNANAKQNYATTPAFSLDAGYYPAAINLSITSPDANVSIYYTTDGSEPSQTSTLYINPIPISNTMVIRAKAFSTSANIPPSFTNSNTYIINETHSIATISVFGDQIDNLLNGGFADADCGLEYFDRANLIKAEATGTADKHGNDSWAYDQRGFDFVSKDQFGTNYALKHKLFDSKDRTEFQRIIVKALANDNYPFETEGAHIRDPYVHTLSLRGGLHLDVRTYEPCVLYLNGQYWGLYDLRERMDDADFIEYYYNSGEKDIQMLKTWGGTWSEFGGTQAQTDWNTLKNYILGNSMAVQANYDYVDNLYNTKSLVDYFVLNSYVVCSDWLNWNTQWWRGLNPNADKKKWRYCLWDEDATFGHYINYTHIPNQTAVADPCFPEQLGDPGSQGHVPVLNALLNNDVFKQYYVARFADLSNTVFSCDNMLFLLDSLISQFDNEMPKQIARWGGNMATWQSNVQQLKDFINQRCVKLSQGMINCYNLTGPYNIAFDVEPPNTGEIKVNSIWVPTYPWLAKYYGNMKTLLKAKAKPGYEFDYWQMGIDSVSPSKYIDSGFTMLTDHQLLIAHFKKIGDTTIIPEVKELEIPNIFTPNGDGKNDFFEIKNNENWTIKLAVYNRWGIKVYDSGDYKNDWNGDKLATATYFYLITATAVGKPPFNHKGSLLLLR